jgi:capsule polysaccharide export protein KpsE/RkpR
MSDNQTVEKQLATLSEKLSQINHNMLKVFWIVAIFALLYFGLMIYMLFLR